MDARLRGILSLQLFVVYFVWLKAVLVLRALFRQFVSHTADIPAGHARIGSILWRRKRDIEEIARDIDFVTVHNCFAGVDTLKSEQWTIYAINKDFAYFVLLPRAVTHYNSQRCPFVYVQHFNEALLVAEVKRADFEALADDLAQNEQPETVFYTNTARCGSTLLAKMLHNEGYSHCVAEPLVIANLTIGLSEGHFSKQDIRSLFPRVITVLRKNIPASRVLIIKTESSGVRLVEFSDGIPQLRHIFSFRKNGIDSVERMLRREAIGDLLTAFYLTSPSLCNWIFGWLTAYEGKYLTLLKPDTEKKRAAICYASPYGEYLKHQDKFALPVIWFHDIIHNTEPLLVQIFETIGISPSLAEEAAKWKNQDSQKGTFLSQDALSHISTTPMTEAEKNDMEHYAAVMGVPADTLLMSN